MWSCRSCAYNCAMETKICGVCATPRGDFVHLEDGMWRCGQCSEVCDVRQALNHDCANKPPQQSAITKPPQQSAITTQSTTPPTHRPQSVPLEEILFPDLAILTVKGVEAEAVKTALLEKGIPLQKVDANGHFSLHSFRCKSAQRDIAVVLVAGANDQGPEKSGIFTMSALHLLKPASVVLVGMCAGLKSCGLGDVAIILNAFPFEGLIDRQGNFQSDGRRVSAGPKASHIANFVTSDMSAHILTRILQDHMPKARMVDAVSGSVVREDGKIDTSQSRKIGAYEMEASSFMTAVQEYNDADPRVRCENLGVYKGVSDLAEPDNRQQDKLRYQGIATRNAVLFFLAALEYQGPPIAVLSTSAPITRAYARCCYDQSSMRAVKSALTARTLAHLSDGSSSRVEETNYLGVYVATEEKQYSFKELRELYNSYQIAMPTFLASRTKERKEIRSFKQDPAVRKRNREERDAEHEFHEDD